MNLLHSLTETTSSNRNRVYTFTLLIMEVTLLVLSFLIRGIVNMRFGQILTYLMANISNIFLVQFLRLEPCSPRSYVFNKMKIY